MRTWIFAMVAPLSLVACDGAQPDGQVSTAPKQAVASEVHAAAPSQAPVVAETVADNGYRWHTAEPGKSVQYGIPDSDDRSLRIDCNDAGQIEIGGPAGVEGPENTAVTATFGEGDTARRLPALLVAAGDGMNFYARVEPDDPALRTLLAGQPLRVAQGDYSWDVPGEGAAAELKPFLLACRPPA